jgi:hypothetical protein
MMGVYGADLANASRPEYKAAFEFAARYAGFHASPHAAPGAWIALREGVGRLKGDYTFLMRRLPGAEMKPEQKIGPDGQRFGAWARTLARGDEAKFELDPEFAASLKSKALLRVIYFDRGSGTFTARSAGRKYERKLTDSGRWQTAEFQIDPGVIAISATTDLTLHMIEVERTQ